MAQLRALHPAVEVEVAGCKLVLSAAVRTTKGINGTVYIQKNGTTIESDTIALTKAEERGQAAGRFAQAAELSEFDVAKALRELSGLAEGALRQAETRKPETTETKAPADVEALRAAAAPVLDAGDPLEVVRAGIQRAGYGGDTRAVELIYLAATTRVLPVRPGSMLAHTLVLGPASAGKSYAVGVVKRLMPPDLIIQIEAGSPRALIYDDRSMTHKVVVFGEADSLPAGEDNPAASAVRGLLQENCMSYDVTEKGEDGKWKTRHIERAGPTVLITTSTKRLGPQLMTRLFTLEVADDPEQVRTALATQAGLEEDGEASLPPELAALQAYLQARAPIDVWVPFARRLSGEIGRRSTEPRLTRDFMKLLSLVKAVTILRQSKRATDGRGRLVATLEDYGTVYGLAGEMYEATTRGATPKVRAVVAAVGQSPSEGIGVRALAQKMGLPKSSVGRHAGVAVSNGWLRNLEETEGKPFRLVVGDPMPDGGALPSPECLASSSGHPRDSGTPPQTVPLSHAIPAGEATQKGNGNPPREPGEDDVDPVDAAVMSVLRPYVQ